MDTRIYISAHKNEYDTGIYTELKSKLIENNYTVNSRYELEFKADIWEFVKTLGQGNYIVTLISDEYLKDKDCMAEMLEIFKTKKFQEKIFPVLLPDAKIHDELDRADYIIFWQSRLKELEKKASQIGRTGTESLTKAITLAGDITRNFDEITDMIREMKCFENVRQLVSFINSDKKVDIPKPDNMKTEIKKAINCLIMSEDFEAIEILNSIKSELSDSQKIKISTKISEWKNQSNNFNIKLWREQFISILKDM